MKSTTLAMLCATASLITAGVPVAVRAQLPPLPANATVYASSLNAPRGLVFGPDGTLYVAEAGMGGMNATGTACMQVPAPVGPYTGGTSARISAIDVHGNRTTLASGLPSSVDAISDLLGVADVTFLDGKLYGLIAGGGCSHGNATLANGIVKVNLNNGKWSYITDLSLFYLENPTAYPDPTTSSPMERRTA